MKSILFAKNANQLRLIFIAFIVNKICVRNATKNSITKEKEQSINVKELRTLKSGWYFPTLSSCLATFTNYCQKITLLNFWPKFKTTTNWKQTHRFCTLFRRNAVITSRALSHQKLNKSLKTLIPIKILMKNQKKRYSSSFQIYSKIKRTTLKKCLLFPKIIITLVMWSWRKILMKIACSLWITCWLKT